MFEDLKQAWNDAVQNFWRELETEEEGAGVHGDASRRQLGAMRKELGSAEQELKRLEAEVARARAGAESERREVETCRRRLAMAESIGDAETARLASSYAERAAERAGVLERKAEALEAERALRARDLTEMRGTLEAATAALGASAAAGAAGVAGGGAAEGVTGGAEPGAPGGARGGADSDLRVGDWHGTLDEEKLRREAEFRRMRKEAAEKAAEARLEELKKKMS